MVGVFASVENALFDLDLTIYTIQMGFGGRSAVTFAFQCTGGVMMIMGAKRYGFDV